MALNLSIKGRLLVLTGLAMAGVAIVVGLFFASNRLNQTALANVYEQDGQTLVRMQRIENTLLEVRFRAAAVLLEQLPVPGSLNHLKESRQSLAKLWAEFAESADHMFAGGDAREQLKQLKDRWAVVDTTLANLEKGYAAKDNKAITGVLEDEWPVMVKGVVKPLQTLIPLAQTRSQDTYMTALSDSRNMLSMGVGGAALCLAVLVVTAVLTLRSILGSLTQIIGSMEAIASGDLASRLPESRGDELGSMVDALRAMQESLSNLVRQVRESAERIEVASDEVASGNADLSMRTENTASNLHYRAAVLVALYTIATTAMAIDLAPLWDFDKPELSEQRFRAALVTARGDDALVLQTQIARAHGLRKEFTEARDILDSIAKEVQAAGAEARARFALERGRTYASATHPPELQTAESQKLARASFERALEIASSTQLDDLAIDAIHMLAFVDTAPVDQLKWGQAALAVVERSHQPRAKKWEASIRNNIGYALHQLGRLDEALGQFRQAVVLRQRSGSAESIRSAHWMVAWTLRGLQRVDEALEMQLRLEQECEAAKAPDWYVFEELEILYRARGDEVQAKRYADLKASLPS